MQSVIEQSIKVDEIVFVDDGSQDNTYELIANSKNRFLRKNIKFKLIKSKNLGAGNARNIAIKNASNKWIAFLDSDDTWSRNKIQRVKDILSQNNRINTILHWEKFIRLDGSIVDLKHGQYFNNINLKEKLFIGNFFSTSALVCKKNLIEKNDYFDVTLKNGQDYDMWLKMANDVHLYIIREFLGNYIEEKNSITLRPYSKRFLNELKIAFKHRKSINMYIYLKKIFQILLSRRWISQ